MKIRTRGAVYAGKLHEPDILGQYFRIIQPLVGIVVAAVNEVRHIFENRWIFHAGSPFFISIGTAFDKTSITAHRRCVKCKKHFFGAYFALFCCTKQKNRFFAVKCSWKAVIFRRSSDVFSRHCFRTKTVHFLDNYTQKTEICREILDFRK